MKMRIQYVIATLDVGGAERQLTALATGLDPTRFEVEVLVLTRGGRFEEELKEASIPYYILDKRPGIDPFVFHVSGDICDDFDPTLSIHGCLRVVRLAAQLAY